MNSVQELLLRMNRSVRPITAKEIELIVDGKSCRNSYKELKKLMDLKIIKKVKFVCEGYIINERYKAKSNGQIVEREKVIKL